MVEEGLFKLFPCDAVYGLHNMPGLAGRRDRRGRGAAACLLRQLAHHLPRDRHARRQAASRPRSDHGGGTFLSSLQTIVGRAIDPLQPAVVSACFLQAGDPKALNVIPDIVEIGGTARAYSPDVRDQLETEIGRLAHGTAAMYGIAVDYAFERRIPPVINRRGCDRAGAHGAPARSSAGRCRQAFRRRRQATISPSSPRMRRVAMSGSATARRWMGRCITTRPMISTMKRWDMGRPIGWRWSSEN